MEQIRIHGRGGQGVVTAAELIALAAFYEGKYAQAFPHFGVERTGAPIQSFARIDNKEIITREQIYKPSVLIIQDNTLLSNKNIFQGVDKNTRIIINASAEKQQEFKLGNKNVYYTDATDIALKTIGKNLVNTVILGAFAKYTKLVSLDSLKRAIEEKFKEKPRNIVQKNIKAIEQAYEN